MAFKLLKLLYNSILLFYECTTLLINCAGLRHELGEMIEWVQDIMADDPDVQTRDLATACILVFQDMSNKVLKEA